MYQAILGGNNENLINSAARYNCLMGGTTWQSSESSVDQTIPTGGTISALRVELSAAPGAGKSYAFVLMVNGAPSTLTCTVSGTDTTASDVSNSVAVVAGDVVTIRCTPSGTPAASLARWSTIFQGTTASESICLFHANPLATGNIYSELQNSGGGSQTEADVKCPMPTAGTFKKLYVKLSAAPGVGKSWDFTLRVGGSSKTLTVNIADAATTGNDTTHTDAVVPGNLVDLLLDPTNTPAGAALAGGLVFVSDVNGESLLFGGTSQSPSTSAVNYRNFSVTSDSTEGAWNATEVTVQSLIQEVIIKKMYVSLSAAPGASKSYKFDIRIEGADSGLSVTISGTDTTGYHLSREDSANSGDVAGIECTPTGTPTATYAHIGLVLITSSATTPTVITGQMMDVTGTTATGRGAVTALNGTVSQHGHCWGATTNPTTADSKTTNGALSSPSFFTSALTGLTGGQGYYARAYATNEFGTSYGLNVYFVADSPIQVLAAVKGSFAVVGETLHYVSATGVEKTLTGT